MHCWSDLNGFMTLQSLNRQILALHPLILMRKLLHSEQNHRMVGVGRDLCGSSSPTLLLKQGHPEQAAQDLVQAGLE